MTLNSPCPIHFALNMRNGWETQHRSDVQIDSHHIRVPHVANPDRLSTQSQAHLR